MEQVLIEITGLEPEHNVFLIGTTNDIAQVDARVLRGGRFSEKIDLGLPDRSGYRRLIEKHLGRARLAEGLTVDRLVEQFQGTSPANLEAACTAAKRFALRRLPPKGGELPALEESDFTKALDRVQAGIN